MPKISESFSSETSFSPDWLNKSIFHFSIPLSPFRNRMFSVLSYRKHSCFVPNCEIECGHKNTRVGKRRRTSDDDNNKQSQKFPYCRQTLCVCACAWCWMQIIVDQVPTGRQPGRHTRRKDDRLVTWQLLWEKKWAIEIRFKVLNDQIAVVTQEN